MSSPVPRTRTDNQIAAREIQAELRALIRRVEKEANRPRSKADWGHAYWRLNDALTYVTFMMHRHDLKELENGDHANQSADGAAGPAGS